MGLRPSHCSFLSPFLCVAGFVKVKTWSGFWPLLWLGPWSSQASSSKFRYIAQGVSQSLVKACSDLWTSHGSFIARPEFCRRHGIVLSKGILSLPRQACSVHNLSIFVCEGMLEPSDLLWQLHFNVCALHDLNIWFRPVPQARNARSFGPLWDTNEGMLGSSAITGARIKTR